MTLHWHSSQNFNLDNCIDDTPTETGLRGYSDVQTRRTRKKKREAAWIDPPPLHSAALRKVQSLKHLCNIVLSIFLKEKKNNFSAGSCMRLSYQLAPIAQ